MGADRRGTNRSGRAQERQEVMPSYTDPIGYTQRGISPLLKSWVFSPRRYKNFCNDTTRSKTRISADASLQVCFETACNGCND